MKTKTAIFLMALLCLIQACGGDQLPKPRAMLRLDYASAKQRQWEGDCPFQFQVNSQAVVKEGRDCAITLEYPGMAGSVFITYKKVNDNIRTLLADAQKLSYEHVAKADNILEQPYVDPENKVFGMFYEVEGDAASQAQFYLTDSTDHFLTGSLYFYARPNYDSIYPAAVYLQNDIRSLMESLRWKK